MDEPPAFRQVEQLQCDRVVRAIVAEAKSAPVYLYFSIDKDSLIGQGSHVCDVSFTDRIRPIQGILKGRYDLICIVVAFEVHALGKATRRDAFIAYKRAEPLRLVCLDSIYHDLYSREEICRRGSGWHCRHCTGRLRDSWSWD